MPIMLLMSVGQYFRYKETQWSDLLRDLKWPMVVSVIVFGLLTWGFEIEGYQFILFLFFGVLLSGLNFAFLFRKRKNQVRDQNREPWLLRHFHRISPFAFSGSGFNHRRRARFSYHGFNWCGSIPFSYEPFLVEK